jgi:hypothetical protein
MTRLLIDAQFVRGQIERLKVAFPELVEDADFLADMVEAETALDIVVTKLFREQRDAGAFANAVREQEKELAERRSRFERRQEMDRSLILSLMQSANMTKLMLAEATLSISTLPPKPIVDDEASVPDELCNFNRWPNMAAIKAAVKAGENVPGVHMSNGGTTLTIRIK